MAKNKSGKLSGLEGHTIPTQSQKYKDSDYQSHTHTKEQAASTGVCIPATPTAMVTATEAWADSPLLLDIHCLVYILQTK